MKAKITLHIYAKTTKANTAGQLPIYFRLTVDGQRFEFSSKKFIEKSKWSPEQSKMKGSSDEARIKTNSVFMIYWIGFLFTTNFPLETLPA